MEQEQKIAAASFSYAGFFTRAAARVVDTTLIFAILSLVYIADRLGAQAGMWPGFSSDDGLTVKILLLNVARILFFLTFPIFYYIYLHGESGQTFGKMAMGIKAVNEDGTPLGYQRAFFRQLGYFLCDMTLKIGYVWAAFDSRKQGLHDKVCGTVVILADDEFPQEERPVRKVDEENPLADTDVETAQAADLGLFDYPPRTHNQQRRSTD